LADGAVSLQAPCREIDDAAAREGLVGYGPEVRESNRDGGDRSRTLEQAHLFNDGNARTVGFLMLDRLLLSTGMSPALMFNPNAFDGFSVSELVQSIRQGQEKFAQYTGALQA
jgi:hypothetical protein